MATATLAAAAPVQEAYIKALLPKAGENLGSAVAISGDTMVVGASAQDLGAGRAYVFVRRGSNWSQQAELRPAVKLAGYDGFGASVGIVGDTIVIGASSDPSSATGVNGNPRDNFARGSGAAYVFVRKGNTWTQQAYLKASNTGANDHFGTSVTISGETVAVGADYEASSETGVNGDPGDDSAPGAGAAYVFVRQGTNWSQQAYIKASNAEGGPYPDHFGMAMAMSGDSLVVTAMLESSNATGINGDQSDNSSFLAGAAYVFVRNGTTWSQQAYLKASNTGTAGAHGLFGRSVAISGNTIVVGANMETSNATGVNGNQNDTSASFAGAAYVFLRTGTTWAQQAYLKASNTGAGDLFGLSVGIWGDTIVVGANGESSNATGTHGNQSDNSATNSGAAYVFVRSHGTWSQQAYLKASNTGNDDNFGQAVAIWGDTVVVGAYGEDSASGGINGNQADNSLSAAGAVYVFVPLGNSPRLVSTLDEAGRYLIHFTGVGDVIYQILRSPTSDGPWETIDSVFSFTEFFEYQDPNPLPGHAFYRTMQP
jgi:hypothetical protein